VIFEIFLFANLKYETLYPMSMATITPQGRAGATQGGRNGLVQIHVILTIKRCLKHCRCAIYLNSRRGLVDLNQSKFG